MLSSVCVWSHGEMALEQMEEVGSRLETAFAGDFGDRRTRTRQAALHLFQAASCDEVGDRLLLRLPETQLCNATRASQMPHHIAHLDVLRGMCRDERDGSAHKSRRCADGTRRFAFYHSFGMDDDLLWA